MTTEPYDSGVWDEISEEDRRAIFDADLPWREAYRRGYEAGFDEGHDAGHEVGYEMGYQDGEDMTREDCCAAC